MSKAEEVGKAGLTGWRERLGDRMAEPTAERTRLNPEQVKAVLGAIFLLGSILYIVSSFRRARKRTATT